MDVSAAEIRELLDKQALYELAARYCRAVDRADVELLLTCYHPDAFDDHGTFKGPPDGLAAYLLSRTMDPAQTPGPIQHSMSNATFEVAGDVAYGEIYVESRIVDPEGARSSGLARYVDRYERRDGEWRIAHRRVILEHSRPGFNVDAFVRGSRDRSDPSYERSVADPSAVGPALGARSG